MLRLAILSLAITIATETAFSAPINVKGTNILKKGPKAHIRQNKRPKSHAMRVLNVHKSAFQDGQDWCRTSGGLKYIQIDPNQNYLYRYICNLRRN